MKDGGRAWALIGGTGAGKTQLLKLLRPPEVVARKPPAERHGIYCGSHRRRLIAAKKSIAHIGASGRIICAI